MFYYQLKISQNLIIIMKIFDRGFREIISSEVVSIIGGLIAGTSLAVLTDKILLLPGMLILLPGFFEMRGNISGSLSARLSSGLFLGVISAEKPRGNIVKSNIIASFLLALLIAFLLGCVASLFSFVFFGIVTIEIIIISLIAVLISNAIEIPLAVFVTFYLFRKGHDPNNIMGPFVTSTGDIISIISLLAAILLV